MRYKTYYDGDLVLTIEINHEKANKYIREMVEFWAGWEFSLANNQGDYTNTWLKSLTLYILDFNKLPVNEDGWYPLSPEYGIGEIKWSSFAFDEDLIEIKT